MTADLPLADELAVVVARMSGLLLTWDSVEPAIEIIATSAGEAIPASAGAGVSLLEGGRRTTAVASDEVVRKADDLQYALDEGPCLSAFSACATHRVDDVRTDPRWPRWGPAAAELGMLAALSAPLLVQDTCVGAVKVYAREAGAFSARDERLLTLFAAQAGVLLGYVRRAEDGRRTSEAFREALRSRDVLNMAKGALMEREGVSEEVAFGLLLSMARARRQDVAQVAASVVEGYPGS
ncbi:two-component system response regulator [Amycolatopsis mediterranei S699]|uniref:Two-component system response regulator n=2 Tax=Amycolatopsis mediterranei TaxID=33910 RepID=A0A0H3DC65_AMYMU|nr:GAF and ANTAR domain-containing protein [Amycolatopsis mediterranei]ADJ48281.1 two-component system response regulator [Amycolatopsis mediterranei U32]AEK45193.1 two-component system response regulator [Amycolatopsis mediterranei S699]AFO79992.1 two-component system response regulator [Amycolatopsis mediterranei S699]AGT87120.1 two-component system response regulator [Amycolatopsis mediterranei RB]KDO10435.1 transcriptional regulator [Amycolatopsis mediterranei]